MNDERLTRMNLGQCFSCGLVFPMHLGHVCHRTRDPLPDYLPDDLVIITAKPSAVLSFDIDLGDLGDLDPQVLAAFGLTPVDPDYDDSYLADLDASIAADRQRLADERARRQTLAWTRGLDEHYRPLTRPHDPTSILDADDPWL